MHTDFYAAIAPRIEPTYSTDDTSADHSDAQHEYEDEADEAEEAYAEPDAAIEWRAYVDPDEHYQERGWLVAGRYRPEYTPTRHYNACEGSRTRMYPRGGTVQLVHGYCDRPAVFEGLCKACFGQAKALGIHHAGRGRDSSGEKILLAGESMGDARGRVPDDVFEEAAEHAGPEHAPRSAKERRDERDIQIRARFALGHKQSDIARDFGLTARQVRRIVRGQVRWRQWAKKPRARRSK
jgi:hypothetical protein